MKSLVVGYGSIGQRHTDILTELGHTVCVVSRRKVKVPILYRDVQTAVKKFNPEYIVIASKSSEHAKDIRALQNANFGGTVLVEKPLFHCPHPKNQIRVNDVFVAYNLRFHPALKRFRDLLEECKIASAHVYVGHYLPEWRKNIDYRQTHSAFKTAGGGVLRELSHELDYINWIFDGWTKLSALGGHFSPLEIDTDDVYSLLIETRRCPVVSVTVNYLDRTLRREAIVHTDTNTIRLDLKNGTVEVGKSVETFTVSKNQTYIGEHKAALSGNRNDLCTFDQGIEVVEMIDAAEMAAKKRIWISKL